MPFFGKKGRKKQKKIMAKKINKNEDSTKYLQSKEPLFAMAKTENGEIIILVGKFRVSGKTFKSFEEAEKYIASKPYELLINVACLFTKLKEDENKNENPQDK